MSATSDARLGELDRVLDGVQTTAGLADELFALTSLVESNPSLRRALTDPTSSEQARRGLIETLLGDKVSQAARAVIAEASVRRWGGGWTLAGVLEREAVRALLGRAQQLGQLDNVEDELFRLGRIVDADHGLRDALSNHRVPLAARQDLLTGLLAGKVSQPTSELARRAVAARDRTFDLTLENYLQLAASIRQRAVAQVRVARPLTEAQAERLRAALTRQLGREVNLQVTVDPEVLGGVRVQVGDEVIEGTVSSKLEEARRHLS